MLGQRLADGQARLGHDGRALRVVRVAQEERGVIDLQHVRDAAQVDGGEVGQARARASPAQVTRRSGAHPRALSIDVHP